MAQDQFVDVDKLLSMYFSEDEDRYSSDWDFKTVLTRKTLRYREEFGESDDEDFSSDDSLFAFGDSDDSEFFESEDDEPSIDSIPETTEDASKPEESQTVVWTKPSDVPERNLMKFTVTPAVKNRMLGKNLSELGCFLEFFSEEAIKLMVEMTNKKYHHEEKNRKKPENSQTEQESMSSWSDITVPEMKAFIAILIHMGLPTIDRFWAKPMFRPDNLKRIMSSDRFMLIFQHLHFSDLKPDNHQEEENGPSSKACQTDKLSKVRKISEIIRSNCVRKYNPGRNLAIDESMMTHRKHTRGRHCVSSTAIEPSFGIKVWVLVESSTSYVSNFQLYIGNDPIAIDCDKEYGLPGAIVLHLMKPFLNEGRHLYMDYFYTSPSLLEELQRNGTYACGHMRKYDKCFPKEFQTIKASINKTSDEHCLMSEKGIVCFPWHDGEPICFLSTIHMPAMKQSSVTETATSTEGKADPPVIKDFNRYMNHVNFTSDIRKYFNSARTSPVLYRKVFGYLLEVCIHNAQVVYEHLSREEVHPGDFRQKLAISLVGTHGTLGTRFDSSKRHFPTRKEKMGNCMYCTERAEDAYEKDGTVLTVHQSDISCTGCNVYLCLNDERPSPCFAQYHE